MPLKVFVSSTCYDLHRQRRTLRDFIANLGHEAILSDYGDVLYDPRVHTHANCVEAVAEADFFSC